MELGYARVSTRKQDLDRQITALTDRGITRDYVWADKLTGSTTERRGLNSLLDYARDGDVLVCYTLDRLGRNLRECLNLIHELGDRGIAVKTLADPLAVDTSDTSAMSNIANAMLMLFAEMERTFALERAAHARAVREAKGKPVGRPKKLTTDKLTAALAAVDSGMSVREVAQIHDVGKDTLYRALERRRRSSSTGAETPDEKEKC